MIRLLIVLYSAALTHNTNINCRYDLYPIIVTDSCDSIITYDALFLEAIKGIEYMHGNKLLKDEQYIHLIRVYNTLQTDSVARNNEEACIFDCYRKRFEGRFFLQKTFKEIGLTIGKGFSYYSSKYDLYVGSSGIIRCRDLYLVRR